MEFVRGFLSSLIMLILVPLLLVSAVLFIAQRTVLDRNYVKAKLDENSIYEQLVEAVPNFFSVDDATAARVIKEEVTAEQVRSSIEPVIDQVYDWFKKGGQFALRADFTPIKAPVAARLPVSLRQELDTIPDSYELSQSPFGPVGSLASIGNLTRLVPLAAIILLSLLYLVNSGRARLRRPAYALFLSGLILGAISGIGLFSFPYALGRYIDRTLAETGFQEVVRPLASDMVGDMTRAGLVAGASLVALAVLLFVASFFSKHPLKIGTEKPER